MPLALMMGGTSCPGKVETKTLSGSPLGDPELSEKPAGSSWMVSSVRGAVSEVRVYSRILSSELSEKASSIVKSGFLNGIAEPGGGAAGATSVEL